MIGWKNGLLLAVFAWLVIPGVVQLYFAFAAPRCPPDAKASACYHSIFAEGEAVDVFVYVTANQRVKWWTLSGLKELQATPVWNVTSLPYGDVVLNTSVIVPLSDPALHSVRRNESMLYAHCYLARAGKPISETLRGVEDSTPKEYRIWPNLLHASGAITRRLPMKKQPRRSLLGNSSDEEKGSETNSTEMDAVPIDIPALGKVSVFPTDGLYWSIAFFSATAFLPPGIPLALPRQIVAVVVVPWLWNLHRQVKERQRAKLQQEAELDQQWWKLQGEAPITPHMVPKLRLALATDNETYDARRPPPLLYKEMEFKGMQTYEKDVRYPILNVGSKRVYAAPLDVETWGMQQRYWRPLDSNVSKGNIEIMLEFDAVGMNRYTVMQTLKQSLGLYMQFGFTERDLDDVRDFMFRHPLHILALMQVIGFMQMVLTSLAFKNDISFFKGRKDYIGLSSRSLASDTLQEIIIFLYLFDYEDISRIVLFQVGMSSLISAWKYVRVSRLSLKWQYALPWLRPTRGMGENKSEQDTEEIDAKGMKYLMWFLYPLSACWGIYNVYNYTYRSWWSWLVSSLADFAYTFGFINMMPQIFINYKLKSVAHMPWRVLGYKFFNTFIDDVFAFFIMSDHMTKKHRYMTLRDDIVFFIFLYQRRIYAVDPTRADEFGYVYGEEHASVANGAEASGEVVTEAGAKFTVYVDKAGKHRWRLQAPNADILVFTTRGFDDEASCREALEKVKHSSKIEANFSREVQKDCKAYFTLSTQDGGLLGRSSGYKSGEDARDEGIQSVISHAAAATVEVVELAPEELAPEEVPTPVEK